MNVNWDKLPKHRRIVLMLREWRLTTLWLDDSQWFKRNLSLNHYEGERLDDNNLWEQ
jgi:hypothetical protein